MKYIYNGRGMDVTEDLRRYVEKKFDKFAKFFNDETEVHVTFSFQREDRKVEVTIPMVGGTTIRAEETDTDMYTAIDLLEEIVERQLQKNRKKLIDKHHDHQAFSTLFLEQETSYEEEENIKIVKSKRFAIKPMDPEEACFQMELSNHSFYVFYNSETDLVSVVYKRKDGNYGLIEPEY